MMKRSDSFDPAFFGQLKRAEEDHFWFQVRKKWICDKIEKFIPPPARILEVGCGTGVVSSYLARRGYRVTGCDWYEEALDLAWPGFQKIKAEAAALPFEEESFDVVGLFDVIEHLPDDVPSLEEAARVVKTGGVIVVTVPAREELWSWVDVRSLHKRRYTEKSVAASLMKAGLAPEKIEYLFMSLYLPMRLLRRREGDLGKMFKIGRAANIMMEALCSMERMFSKVFALPIGTSLIAFGRKQTADTETSDLSAPFIPARPESF